MMTLYNFKILSFLLQQASKNVLNMIDFGIHGISHKYTRNDEGWNKYSFPLQSYDVIIRQI